MIKSTAVAALLVLLMTGGVHSSGMPPVANSAESATTGVAVSEFVGPDGRIDLDAMRQSGYEGALDLEGFDMTIDPSTGQPLVRSSVPVETDSGPDDIYWSPLGSGMDGRVLALTVYDGNLIAGGDFTTAGGVAASHIASWDGSSWSPLGSEPPLDPGCDDRIVALTVYDGKLIAAGDFHTAGGVAANHIASWDGSNWSPLGSGTSARIYALTVYDGKLIAGGYFTEAGGVTTGPIASWDGSSWSPLGSATLWSMYAVLDLTVYNGNLIAARRFYAPGGFSSIYSWDGSGWSSLLTYDNITINALSVYDGKLVAGGAIWAYHCWDEVCVWLVTGGLVQSWNGANWSRLGSGMNGEVNALTVYGGELIAGGDFNTAGDVEANHIASWDGTSWSPLGSGTDGSVLALTGYNNELIVGGNFTTAGDKAAAYIAAWTKWCCQLRGDIDHDGAVLPTDAVYFVDWLWRGGPEPPCWVEADVNGDESVDPQDCIYFVNYMWNGGPAPVPCP